MKEIEFEQLSFDDFFGAEAAEEANAATADLPETSGFINEGLEKPGDFTPFGEDEPNSGMDAVVPNTLKEDIKLFKDNPDVIKAKAIERLKGWLNTQEAAKLDAAIVDVKASLSPESSWQLHMKLQKEYNQNILLVAGIIPEIEKNEVLAADSMHPAKSLQKLISFVSDKAKEEAEKKAKQFGGSTRNCAVIESNMVYEWALDYFFQDEDKLEAERKAKQSKAKADAEARVKSNSSKKKASKKDEGEQSLFDFFSEEA